MLLEGWFCLDGEFGTVMTYSYDPFSEDIAVTPLGRCEYCNEEVFDIEHAPFEEDVPYQIDSLYFHERCIMPYAEANWKVCGSFAEGDEYEFIDD